VRNCDVLARYGGEEFVVELPLTDARGAIKVAERIRERVAALRLAGSDGITLKVSVSLGIASITRGTASLGELIGQAEMVMHRAKLNGRNRAETDAVIDHVADTRPPLPAGQGDRRRAARIQAVAT
jgi:two-component system cell cycle response regulator